MHLSRKFISPYWILLGILPVLLVPNIAFSQSAELAWQVRLTVGEVVWRELPADGQNSPWLPLRAGELINPPAEIETAVGARVELQRAEDSIQAGPESRLTLDGASDNLFTRIRQAAGAIWYKVKSIPERTFEVEGTYLVATVKGTEFKITLGKVGDLLMVTEGVVRASPRAGGEAMDVKRGQSVLATSAGLLLLTPLPDGERSPTAPAPAPDQPAPTPDPQNPPPDTTAPPDSHSGKTGDVHGVNGSEKHNHGGTGGADVRDMHGDSVSGNGGGAKAAGPK